MDLLRGLWRRTPVVVRAVLLGFLILEIGSNLTVLPLLGNIYFHPEIPWAFPATLLVLAAFWAWFSGRGFPKSTKAVRSAWSRNVPVSPAIWLAAIPAIVFGSLMLVTLRLVAPYVLPVAPPSVSISLSRFPIATVVGALLAISISAAVVEETAFRGYMQRPIEERHGIVVALLITGVMFWVAHLDKVTITHLPGHLAASIVFGLLAWFTRSLAPAMVAHAATDLVLQPSYFSHVLAFVWRSLSARPLWAGKAGSLASLLHLIGDALAPGNMVHDGPDRVFAILIWTFVAMVAATVVALRSLRRVSQRHDRKAGGAAFAENAA